MERYWPKCSPIVIIMDEASVTKSGLVSLYISVRDHNADNVIIFRFSIYPVNVLISGRCLCKTSR